MKDKEFIEQFKALFRQDQYALPMRWDGEDFYATLYKHLKDYREAVEKSFPEETELCKEVKEICQGIYLSVNDTFQGKIGDAYKRLSKVMIRLAENDALFMDEKEVANLKDCPFYRVVDAHDTASHDRKRIFHVPFSLRSKMATTRYSIPGFPSLYLCTSLLLCCEETGISPTSETAIAARFKLDTEARKKGADTKEQILEQIFDNDKFYIANLADKPKDVVKEIDSRAYGEKYLYLYPLLAACSYIRAKKDDPFSPEYIVPQMVTQWVQAYDRGAVVGIKYFSCKSKDLSEKGYNYVFPTTGTPQRVRTTVIDYCARLSHRFRLTVPVHIKDDKSIEDCQDALEKDEDLKYIEDWKTVEKEPEGEVTIPDGEPEIGDYAFWQCGRLTKVTIPDSVICIGKSAFEDCSVLPNVEIPDSVKHIKKEAFKGCTGLNEITIPASVEKIGRDAFKGCGKLSKVNYTGSRRQWNQINIRDGNDILEELYKKKKIIFNYKKPDTP